MQSSSSPSLPTHGDGFGYFYEDGRMVILNPGSGQLCNPGGLSAWIEARDRNSAETRKRERAEEAKAARKRKAEDYRVLGPLYGQLAQLIRKRRAEAASQTSSARPALKRTRRRRRLKAD